MKTTQTKLGPLQRGVSLLEMLIVMAVCVILVGAAAPSLRKSIERHRLESATAQLETELQFARSLAIASNRNVRFSFQANTAQSCYVIHTGAANACQCEGASTVCTAGATAIRSVSFDSGSGLRGTSNSASFLFDPAKGTVTPTATLEMRNAQGDVLRLVINIMGRVRSCTSTGMLGYKNC